MSTAKHLTSSPMRLLANACFGKVSAVIGATAAAFTTTGTPAYSFNGFLRALTAQTNTALAALAAADLATSQANWVQPAGGIGFYTQPAGTTVYYVIGVTSAGAWKVVQGTYDGQQLGMPGYTALGKSVIPDVPENFVPVTVAKVVTAGSAFVPGTTALTGLATFSDVSVLPIDGTF